MRKLIVSTFLTLDGVMQAPGGTEEDTEGGFNHGGWQMSYIDEAFGQAMDEAFRNTGGMLLGRKTYDIFAGYWPTTGKKEAAEIAGLMNSLPKYVASRTLEKAEWQNTTLLKGDLAEAVTKLKAEDGKDIYVIGSGDLTQTLMKHGLIDEYALMIHPLVLGNGKKLFRDGGPKQELELLSSKPTTTGVMILRYKTKGK